LSQTSRGNSDGIINNKVKLTGVMRQFLQATPGKLTRPGMLRCSF
jgi:hypothetical protein